MFNRLICCLAMVAITFSAGEASAWHRHHRHGFHHYHVGGYSSFYGYGGGWPYYSSYAYVPSFSIGYSYRPSIYYRSFWPSFSYSTYYAPTYYVPTYSVPVYSFPTYSYPACYASPVIYDSVYSSTGRSSSTIRSLAVATGSSRTASVYAGTSYAGRGYSSLKPVASPTANYTVRTSTTPYAVPDTSVSAVDVSASSNPRYVAAGTTSMPSVDVAGSVTKDVPDELLQSADAILAAGGYREAAQAYAQLALRYGSSDALAMRRFIAQVAGGNYEQAAVISDLALASGSNLQDISLPRNTLQATLGASAELILQRTEGLAANALLQPNDATPMAAVATWLSLSGDRERAELFSRRVEQLRGTSPAVAPAVDRLAALPTIR